MGNENREGDFNNLISPEEYKHLVKKYINNSTFFIGACCGSNPNHINKIRELVNELIEINALAKINLGLNVLLKEKTDIIIWNIFLPLFDLYDKIHISKSDSFSFKCNNKLINDDKNNLIIKPIKNT
jgi:ATP-dependent phosphoenolpyruvate carboxykinase